MRERRLYPRMPMVSEKLFVESAVLF